MTDTAETAEPTMSTEIDVDVDPATAFTVFTEELDQWWGNGPIDAWDSSRAVGRRLEPGVGGRMLEIYEDDALELGRITIWEPGVRVAWTSSVDDATIEVTFAALDGGRTRVRVDGRATGPNAGAGFSYVRMTPQWLPRHLARRAAGRTRPPLGPLHVVIRDETPAATARWLVDAFGFAPPGDIPADEGDPGHAWVELRVGRGEAAVILWGRPPGEADADATAIVPWVFVDDLDTHLAQAEAAGARIVEPVSHHGFRSYTAADPAGRHWLRPVPARRRGRKTAVTPDAAPTEIGRRPGATRRLDPPCDHQSALAFVRSHFIARRSRSSGGRCPFSERQGRRSALPTVPPAPEQAPVRWTRLAG